MLKKGFKILMLFISMFVGLIIVFSMSYLISTVYGLMGTQASQMNLTNQTSQIYTNNVNVWQIAGIVYIVMHVIAMFVVALLPEKEETYYEGGLPPYEM